MNTRDRLAERLADVLIAHGQRRHDEESGVLHCRCGWSGPYLSRHQRDTLLPVVDAIAAERAAEAWDEGCEAGADHAANNGRLGIPHDPPSNPYARAAGLAEDGR